jgi:hypothetical protein
MNLLQQLLSILCPPRLPRLRREEMADCAEYHNRLERHRGADVQPPGAWVGRVSNEHTGDLRAPEAVEEPAAQPILRRARLRALVASSAKTAVR